MGITNSVFKNKNFPRVVQAIGFALFLAILLDGFFPGSILPPDIGNLALIVMWNLFWPLIIVGLLFVTRGSWCGWVCPGGTTQDAIGKTVSANRRFPRFLRSPLVLILIFFGVTYWAEAVHIESHAFITAAFLAVWFGALTIVSLVFKDRAWCTYLCPIGSPLGFYSTGAFSELRTKPEVCKECTTRECIKGGNPELGCPMYINVPTIDSNRTCIWCMRCLKNCPHDSVLVRLRKFGTELITMRRPLLSEAIFAAGLLAFLSVMEGRVKTLIFPHMEAILPSLANPLFDRTWSYGALFALIVALYIVIFAGLALASAKLVGGNESTRRTAARFGFAYLPFAIGAFFGHQFPKFVDLIGKYVGWQKTSDISVELLGTIIDGKNFTRFSFTLLGFIFSVVATFWLAHRLSRDREISIGKGVVAVLPHLVFMIGIMALFMIRFTKFLEFLLP